jgi:hypothetical protein
MIKMQGGDFVVNLEKMKKYEDLKDELADLRRAAEETIENEKDKKLHSKVDELFEQFEQHFRDNGFTIKKGESSLEASYKSRIFVLKKRESDSKDKYELSTKFSNELKCEIVISANNHSSPDLMYSGNLTVLEDTGDEMDKKINKVKKEIQDINHDLLRVYAIEYFYRVRIHYGNNYPIEKSYKCAQNMFSAIFKKKTLN